ncbi:DUF4097 family beta strand repeat-containing protein [Sediminitomix flava]|uniref:Adhesin n=1 Tax=Sediminitomix flava TaxID=379075 RepID=A0A315ZIN5_SEDFL|nr:hypothetical protein [Sediminitomix flava]PWJ45069.1 hypothetical protein BC781_1011473 [Sediminitomix flava]
MFRILLLISAFLFGIAGREQTAQTFQQEVKVTKDQSIELELKFAEFIQVKGWKEDKLKIVAVVELDTDYPYEEVYQLIVDKNGQGCSVRSEYDFDKMNKYEVPHKNGAIRTSSHFKVKYQIFLPKNQQFSLESINGDIELREVKSKANVKTINGFIDLEWDTKEGADFSLSTLHGDIYSDLDFPELTKRHVGAKLSHNYEGGGEEINLKVINGDIYLRKSK